MKHDGNQILIELTILFILVLIISLMFFVIKKISVERTFLQFWPIIAWSVFQKQAITSFRGILMSESQIQIKRNYLLLVECWSKSDNVYILTDSQEFICINYRNCQKLTCRSEKIPMENMGATVCTLLTDVLG